VLDLSCRRRDNDYFVVTDRWQKFTDLKIYRGNPEKHSPPPARNFSSTPWMWKDCAAAWMGELVSRLGDWSPIPTTYAGGASSLADLETVTRLGQGRIDLTIGSALDIFGGTGVRYQDVVAFNRAFEKKL